MVLIFSAATVRSVTHRAKSGEVGSLEMSLEMTTMSTCVLGAINTWF
jgi:hypothetical protein